jgi:cytosine deaminase
MEGIDMANPTKVIRNVRPLGEAAVDVLLEGDQIGSLVPAGQAPAHLPELIDGQGQLLLPSLVEGHVHLDKTLWNIPWRPNSAGPTRWDRITNEHAVLRDEVRTPLAERAGPLIEHCIAQGSLHIRSHVDAQTLFGRRHIEDMLALRQKYASLIDLQYVTFPQGGMLISPGTTELMALALELGVDVVGGIDPAVIDRDPIRALETIFGMADRFARPIDIHLHDLGDLGRWEIERICDFTQEHGMQGRVVISHAYCLGAFPSADLHPLADRLAELGITILTCVPMHFTVPPVAMLRQRGVNVAAGSDGVRDAWGPTGNGDMLERAMFLALRYGWSKDEQLGDAFDIVTHGGAKALGLGGYGLAAGCRADLLLVPAENVAEAVINRSPNRTVISRGRVVARDGAFLGI